MDIESYFKSNVYPVLKNTNTNSNLFQKQEQFILTNKHIVKVDYIKNTSTIKETPFERIEFYIHCECCKEINKFYWKYDSNKKNIDVIHYDLTMDYNGLKNLDDFYSKAFYNICQNCMFPVYI